MDLKKITAGYQNEVNYQKKMLQNLQYWLQTLLAIAAIGLVLCYYFYGKTTWLFIVGVILLVFGVLGGAIVAYGRHRGKQNVKLIISDYEKKVNYLKNK
ncbi:uncharacterized protein JF73_02640 [Lactobacillus helsingborgensis]|uniref:DUF202 domain-containing protein n=2 Tax=Lactobacillus TaxID=1578 RepID=A0A0F4M6I8_9LACO|nr:MULTISPECIES: PTS fructose transporter subunit IA [Lactobacillus]MBC6342763.1 DUF202 domain-containing protein [Lactobacillus kimbladii]MBI0109639.1 DUF202 domain-containing protein [Lactobacillus sp. W8093]AIS08583.1 PTS system, fructose- and mannose-inducible putative EII component [Lactobacillus sp. wkB8]AWN32896.1 PTS fructose transporter subunit IA [Lactobacillus helsingborgensis]KJY66193.1 uncharacterized protein JF73_02640 [Lactobacillus helsingborgensis]